MTSLRAAVALASAALTVTALVLIASAGGSTRSGLYGTVTRGPTMPVCRADQPCEEPAARVTLVFSRAGRVGARARTDARGRYHLVLPPGRYAVRTTARSFQRIVDPALVRVPRARYARVNFSIDTGIR
jgi:hypothetical protein